MKPAETKDGSRIRLRLVLFLVLVGLAVAAIEDSLTVVLPTAAALLALDLLGCAWVERTAPRLRPHVHPAVVLQFAAAALLAVVIGHDLAAAHGLLPMLLVPALRIGEHGGRALATWIVACASLLLFTVDRFFGPASAATDRTSAVLWLGIAGVTGLVGARWAAIERDREESTPRAAQEAAALLRRLDTLAGSLDTGFDVPAAGELILAELASQVTVRRAAVLVGHSADPAVPLAVRGCDRVPWPDPSCPASPLRQTWQTGESGLVEWEDTTGPRTLLCVAIHDVDGRAIGVLVADREASLPFARHDLRHAEEVVHQHGPTLDVALSFAALREHAGMEERERLAREMHDGIAQELVALGYQIDVAKRVFADSLPHVPNPMVGLRTDLTHVLSGLRLRISDLRLTVRPDRGLGAVIGDRLQRFGSASNLSVSVHLNESGFRLPAQTETALYRLFLQVLEDARHAPGASAIDVRLTVAAPQAFLRITHDGSSELHQRLFDEHPLLDLGGQVVIDRLSDAGVIVQVSLHGTPGRTPKPLTHERMPQR